MVTEDARHIACCSTVTRHAGYAATDAEDGQRLLLKSIAASALAGP